MHSENNGLVLFFTTLFWRWNCFLSLVTTDDKDGHGVKFGKTGPTLQVLMLCLQKPQRGSELQFYPICYFSHAFLEESLKKTLKSGSNVAEFNTNEENIYCSHSFVSDSAHVKYIYYV